MRSSGASLAEPLQPGAGLGLLTLGNTLRLGLFAVIVAALVFSLVVAEELGWSRGLLCLTATAALLAAALPLMLGGGRDLGEPIWFVILLVAVGTTGKAFYVIFGPVVRTAFLLRGKTHDELLPAALAIAAGTLCLVFGYLSGNLRWRLPGADRLTSAGGDVRRFVAVVGILSVGGLYAFVVFAGQFEIALDSLAELSSKRLVVIRGAQSFLVHGYLRWGALLLETAFFLIFTRWAASGRRLRSAAGAAVLIYGLAATAFPFFVSNRQGVMFLIIRMGIVWLYLRGEPAPRKALAVAMVSLLLFGSMLALRRDRTSWQGFRREVGVQGLLETTVGGRHFLDLTKTAHILDGVPRLVEFQYGRSFVTWLVAPIPRSLWPSKPKIGVGGDLAPIFGTVWTSGVPPGIVAELYLNFGILGILVGMLLAGALLRSLYATLRPRFPEPAFVLIYAFLSTRIGLGMLSASVAGSATRLLQEMIPLTLALMLCGASLRPAAGEER